MISKLPFGTETGKANWVLAQAQDQVALPPKTLPKKKILFPHQNWWSCNSEFTLYPKVPEDLARRFELEPVFSASSPEFSPAEHAAFFLNFSLSHHIHLENDEGIVSPLQIQSLCTHSVTVQIYFWFQYSIQLIKYFF